MDVLDTTIVTIALPTIARELHIAGINNLQWLITIYGLTYAGFLFLAGRFADIFERRKIFMTGIALFGAGSLLAGLSSNYITLIIWRAWQGFGAAFIASAALSLLISVFEEGKARNKAMAVWGAVVAGGVILGLFLGGVITQAIGWRWIFFINVPISILGICLALRFMENLREEEVLPLNLAGFVLSASGLSLFMFGLSTADEQLVDRRAAAACIVLGGALLGMYLRRARREPTPLLDFGFFRFKTFFTSVGGGLLFRIGLGSLALLLPLLLQLGFGLSPFRSGLLTCASALGSLFIRSTAKMFLRRFGFRRLLGFNALLSGITIASFGLFTVRTSHVIMFLVLLVAGGFHAVQFTSLNSLSYAEIPDREVSRATSLFATIQQLSLGLGVTVGGFCLRASNFFQGHSRIVAADFWPAFLVVGIFTGASAPFAFSLSPDAGEEMAGRAASPASS